MIEQEVGHSPDGDGLSQAEPEVSALRASIPSADFDVKSLSRCQCRVCRKSRMLRAHLSQINEPHRTFFEELADELFHTEDELNWYQSVFDGSWPTAVEILQNHLAQAIETRSAETAGLSPQGESAVVEDHAP